MLDEKNIEESTRHAPARELLIPMRAPLVPVPVEHGVVGPLLALSRLPLPHKDLLRLLPAPSQHLVGESTLHVEEEEARQAGGELARD